MRETSRIYLTRVPRTPVIRARWNTEFHDSDWDGTPNQMDDSPIGPSIRRGYRGLLYRDFWYRGRW